MGIRKGYVAVGSGALDASQTVNAATETLTASEPSPTVTIGESIDASTESLTASEPAVTVSSTVTISVSVGTLTASEPDISIPFAQTIGPTVGALSATEPAVTVGAFIGVTVASLTATEPSTNIRIAGPQTINASDHVLDAVEPQVALVLDNFSIDNDFAGTTGQGELEVIDISVDYRTLSLTWVVTISRMDTLRKYATNAGELNRVVDSDGGWITLDDSNENNEYQVKPPISLQPPLTNGVYLVDSYSESSREAGNVKEIDIDFMFKEERDTTSLSVNQTAASDEWQFDFENGSIALDTVSRADTQSRDDIEFVMQVTPEQAEIVMTSAVFLDATHEVEIPEGDDFVRDTTPDDSNTITITSPTDLSADWFDGDGDYVVRSWSVNYVAEEVYEIDLTARKLP